MNNTRMITHLVIAINVIVKENKTMKKWGIKKTKGNIIILFLIGMLIGIVLGLRAPLPQKTEHTDPQNIVQPVQ